MTSQSRKKFPVPVSETERVKITLPCFKSLTAADSSPKDGSDQLFNFQGPVISECTIVCPVFVQLTIFLTFFFSLLPEDEQGEEIDHTTTKSDFPAAVLVAAIVVFVILVILTIIMLAWRASRNESAARNDVPAGLEGDLKQWQL